MTPVISFVRQTLVKGGPFPFGEGTMDLRRNVTQDAIFLLPRASDFAECDVFNGSLQNYSINPLSLIGGASAAYITGASIHRRVIIYYPALPRVSDSGLNRSASRRTIDGTPAKNTLLRKPGIFLRVFATRLERAGERER